MDEESGVVLEGFCWTGTSEVERCCLYIVPFSSQSYLEGTSYSSTFFLTSGLFILSLYHLLNSSLSSFVEKTGSIASGLEVLLILTSLSLTESVISSEIFSSPLNQFLLSSTQEFLLLIASNLMSTSSRVSSTVVPSDNHMRLKNLSFKSLSSISISRPVGK